MKAATRYLLLAVLLVASVAAALSIGSETTALSTALTHPNSLDARIVFGARLPRVLLAVIAGAGLASVGGVFQALLRNPLAEPYLLGVSGGAATGATFAIVLGIGALSVAGVSLVPVAALIGGLAATGLVYAIARGGGETSGTAIILAGVIVNALCSAVITFLKTLVEASKAQELLFWLMGFLEVPATGELVAVAVIVAFGLAVLYADAGRFNLLALGRLPAAHLGVDVRRLELRALVSASVVVGAVVSLTGLIGFVGLIVPHAIRRLFGPDHRHVLPASALLGALTLVLCDVVARVSFRWLGTEPPVGAVTALIGCPAFLIVMVRTRQRSLA